MSEFATCSEKKRDLRTAWNISYVIERVLICAGGVWLIGSLHTSELHEVILLCIHRGDAEILDNEKKKKKKDWHQQKKKNGMGAAGKSFKLSSSCFLAIFWSEAPIRSISPSVPSSPSRAFSSPVIAGATQPKRRANRKLVCCGVSAYIPPNSLTRGKMRDRRLVSA